ncbi:MAG: hypothetical protein ABGY09_01600 [Euryarchaeota archaeon]
MRGRVLTAAASLTLLALLIPYGPDYLGPAALLLEGGSKSKVASFLLVVATISLLSAIVKVPDRPALRAAVLLLPFLSNALHCVGALISGFPPDVEIFTFDGVKLEGDSPFHTHLGKSAVSSVLPLAPSTVHSGLSLCRLYPAPIRAVELAVVVTSLTTAAAVGRGPITCLAGALLTMSTVDGGGFSLPYVHGCWIMAVSEALRGRTVSSLTFGLAAVLSPYAKLVLGTVVTSRYYGSRWDRILLVRLSGPKSALIRAGARPIRDDLYAIDARDRGTYLRRLEAELRREGCGRQEVLMFPNIYPYLMG